MNGERRDHDRARENRDEDNIGTPVNEGVVGQEDEFDDNEDEFEDADVDEEEEGEEER
jgi:hypothetical protein